MDIGAAFGRVLKQMRTEKDLSQESLALNSGYDRTYISLLERGHRAPSLKTVFDKAATGEPAGFLAGKYILRYMAFGAILTIINLTKTVPVVAVLLGLASFALAIIFEAFLRIFNSFFNK